MKTHGAPEQILNENHSGSVCHGRGLNPGVLKQVRILMMRTIPIPILLLHSFSVANVKQLSGVPLPPYSVY